MVGFFDEFLAGQNEKAAPERTPLHACFLQAAEGTDAPGPLGGR